MKTIKKSKVPTITTMLRVIMNGQSSLRSEMLAGFKKVNKRIDDLQGEMRGGFRDVNNRTDVVGKDLACLEDDAPTWEEHDRLEKRVKKIEKKLFA